jgi:phosphatidylserine/phosphatidylglycerophosphate/cardiolipin synthase-like enzyme
MLREAGNTDLPGNREWHVVIENETLAKRFRAHIVQDFERSVELAGRVVAESTTVLRQQVEVPADAESVVLERRPPSRILEPLVLDRRVRVRPLLTPDREGAIYSEAVLELIRSARSSLLFQIPYIAMPGNPRADRGYIDELIATLAHKLSTLDDARLLLRAGGSKLSDPTHAAWYFKSKGVDIARRVRRIEDHHTKGMVVDGQRVLIGSHNWSRPGVTLNRDASLLFYDRDLAEYFSRAFEVDWERARPIPPKEFRPATPRGSQRESVVGSAPVGYRSMTYAEALSLDS